MSGPDRVLCAYAPASVGNFIAGFDVLGAALEPIDGSLWGDVVTARAGDPRALVVSGPYAHALPDDPGENLVARVMDLYARALAARGRKMDAVALSLHKGLPICSGLGSSAASVAAAVLALDAWHDGALGPSARLALAGEGEGLVSGSAHLDNVGPSLRGGLQLILPSDVSGGCRTVPFFTDWRLAVVHPDVQVSTAAARAALPEALPLGAAVGFAQNLAALVQALYSGDRAVVARCLRDTLAEPHRKALVPGFDDVQAAALGAGAIACSLSGSGPSMVAITTDGDGPRVLAAMDAAFQAHGLATTARLCRPGRGARLLDPQEAP